MPQSDAERKAMFGKLHASPKLTSDLVDFSKSIDSLEKSRFNGTSAFWKEKIIQMDTMTKLIKDQKLDTSISHAVPEPEPKTDAEKLQRKLNTKFGTGEDDDLLPVSITRIRVQEIDDGKIKFFLNSNTGDKRTPEVLKKLGFKVIDTEDIIDNRRFIVEGKL